MKSKTVSVIVPTLNEEGNIEAMIERLERSFMEKGWAGEIIFVDDHSTDRTMEKIRSYEGRGSPVLAVRGYEKRGSPGKAYSLMEGFEYAQYPILAMIDGDLQYPPEAIVPMAEKIQKGETHIVVANRIERKTSRVRTIISRSFVFFFSKLLHGLHCDVQSGLKVFRKKILDEIQIDPTPWTFDLEFLLSALHCGFTLDTVDITFAERQYGKSKVKLFQAIFEIGWSALKLKFRRRFPQHIPPKQGKMTWAGVAHKKQRFITHTTLDHTFSAFRTFLPWQRNGILLIGALILVGLFLSPLNTVIILVGILSAIYFLDVFFNMFVVFRSLQAPPEIRYTERELQERLPQNLPVYSVLCPLYREAHMLPLFLEGMKGLDWPKEKLDVLILLEEDDEETRLAAEKMSLPSWVRVIVVPHSFPKTKPKACNYGLAFARGEYIVVYDAEDRPDPRQLKKAYLAFRESPPNVRCIQAKLNYFNADQNLLTRLFTTEYSLWFDVILPGLQSIHTSIPLGGTSNHFHTRDLIALEGWDPFNVTEDCDLGIRIFKRGYTTAIIDSVTLEEANSQVRNWLRQRSRWLKGYMQTYLVHMRQPLQFIRENGIHTFVFQLIVGGKIAFIIINPIWWLMTLAYFLFYGLVGERIQEIFPPLIFYMAVTSLIFGNFLYLYYYMIGCAKRRHYELIKYVFLIPFYWFLVSFAALIALYQLFVKPHYWEKTHHGLHFLDRKKIRLMEQEVSEAA